MAIATAKQDMSQNNFREAGYWLDKTVDQLLTEAVHLGFSADEVVTYVSERVEQFQWGQATA